MTGQRVGESACNNLRFSPDVAGEKRPRWGSLNACRHKPATLSTRDLALRPSVTDPANIDNFLSMFVP
jgi:hypothetical protein